MGVPKFYRWISERYPCLSEVVREYQIPEFDNLYLDMNGIIHNCSHPNDDDPHFRISEENIFAAIFHYIEVLFSIIKPRKVFFMAVDGVAPRAKMNQQRGRRFRSARESENLEKQAIDKGEILPKEDRFDSNCITPGTVFMAKLHEQLKYFVNMKITTDKLWQGLRIYLSGHETPGEGEHKIMEFIRSEKSRPNFNPNTRHCLYGLDADLIMLGLTSHEPHFSLLREEVKFGNKRNQKRNTTTPEEITFHLLHLSLLREYLEWEFSALKETMKVRFDLERIIDDWVLMGFLVGNDFIPHLPQLHIAHDALPLLYQTYINIMPTLDGYINEDGYLNLARFEKFLRALSKFDYDHFNDTYSDLKWLESRSSRSKNNQAKEFNKKNEELNKPTENVLETLLNIDDDDYLDKPREILDENEVFNAIHKKSDISGDEEEEEDEESLFEMEFRQHKRDYYMNKLELESVNSEVLEEQAHCYVTAIQWNLFYYYNGICSWSWFYPHHYAPFISDVHNFSHMKLNFELGLPFLPFEQLLAVLPSASKKLIPKAFQSLMYSEKSPIIHYYPIQFRTDLNGKQQDWEAVVLIPFIDEKKLLEAMEPLIPFLTQEERERNRHGPCLLYTYTENEMGSYPSKLSNQFPDIQSNHAVCKQLDRDEFNVPTVNIYKGLCSDVTLDVFFPGFPTFKHIKHTASLKKANVDVFGYKSRGDNTILKVSLTERKPLQGIAEQLIGRIVLVGWPHLFEARVTAVSDGKTNFSLEEPPGTHGRLYGNNKKPDIAENYLNEVSNVYWNNSVRSITEKYFGHKGVEVGEIPILIYAEAIQGMRYLCDSQGNVVLEKQWSVEPEPFALQLVVQDFVLHFPTTYNQVKTITELFPPNATCFMLGFPFYGCTGEVIEIRPNHEGRVRVKIFVPQEPNLENVKKNECYLADRYLSASVIGKRLGVTAYLISCFTGTVLIEVDNKEKGTTQKINIGLNLKFNRRNKEVPGFTRKTEEGWLYSVKTLEILKEYLENFPEVFEAINKHMGAESHPFDLIFPEENGLNTLAEVQSWLKNIPSHQANQQDCGIPMLDEGVVRAIEEEVNLSKTNEEEENFKKGISKSNKKIVTMQVRAHLLFRPLKCQGRLISDPSTEYQLYDRVVNIRIGYSVPLGLRGTVIGIGSGENFASIMYEVVFDEEFVGGIALRCSQNKGYKMPAYSMINITHGQRKERSKDKRTIGQKPSNSGSVNKTEQNIAQKPAHFAKLNHSPNSPFEPRQALHCENQQRRDFNYGPPGVNFFSPPQRKFSNHVPFSSAKPFSQQNRNPPSQYYNKDRKQNFGMDDFSEMWKQMPKSESQAPGSYHNNPKDHSLPTLQQAAFALKNTNIDFRPHWALESAPMKCTQLPEQSSKTKITVLKKEQEIRATNADQSKLSSNSNEEFSAMLASLEISENRAYNNNENSGLAKESTKVYDEASSEVLCNLLKIGSHSNSEEKELPNAALSNNSNTSSQLLHVESKKPAYGRPLSIEELFRAQELKQEPPNKSPPPSNLPASSKVVGSRIQVSHPQGQVCSLSAKAHFQGSAANQSTGIHSQSSNGSNLQGLHYTGSVLHPPSQAKLHQGHHIQVPHQQSHNNSNYSQSGPMCELIAICKMMGLDMPNYQYSQNQNKSWNAVVLLGRGLKFETYSMPSKQQAADNVAMIASMRLRSHFLQSMGRLPGSFPVPNFIGQQPPVFPMPSFVMRHPYNQAHSNLSPRQQRPMAKFESERCPMNKGYVKPDANYQSNVSNSYQEMIFNRQHLLPNDKECNKQVEASSNFKSSSTNPFIPLQVTRQQKNLTKPAIKPAEHYKDNTKSNVSSVENFHSVNNNNNVTTIDFHPVNSPSKIKATDPLEATDSKTTQKRIDSETLPKKRSKSRLAIKFGVEPSF